MHARSIAVLVALAMVGAPAAAIAAPSPVAFIDKGPLPASPVTADPIAEHDDHEYTLDLTAGELLTIELSGPAGTDFDLGLYTDGPEGPEMVASSAALGSQESCAMAAPVSAAYTVLVTAYQGSGPYTLTWSRSAGEPDDVLPGAVLPPSPVAGAFQTGGAPDDYYSIHLTAGQVLSVDMDVPDDADFDLRLYRPGTTWIDLPWGFDAFSGLPAGCDERIVYRARQTGDHYLRVEAREGVGSYALRWQAAAGLEVARVAGPDRVTTAIEASRDAFRDGASAVIIATARDWPDALGGAALTGLLGAPMLLTEPGHLPEVVAEEIERLGASEVVILGGTGAVSAAVGEELADVPGVESVDRIAGADRYETAEAIAARVAGELAHQEIELDTAFVATGEAFPDALAASPIASLYAFPIFLVPPQAERHQGLVDRMRAAGVDQAFVLGGTGAVPATLERMLETSLGAESVERLAGDSRYTTAVEVAEFGIDRLGLTPDGVAVATGQDFPDALAAGPMQARETSILLLTHTAYLDEPVGAYLRSQAPDIAQARVVGGVGAVSEAVRLSIEQALRVE